MIAFLFDDPKNMESMTNLCCKYDLDVNLAMDSKSLLSQNADMYLTDRIDLYKQYSDMPNLIYVSEAEGDITSKLDNSEKRCIKSFDALPSYLEGAGIKLIQYENPISDTNDVNDFSGFDPSLLLAVGDSSESPTFDLQGGPQNLHELFSMDSLTSLADDMEIEYAPEPEVNDALASNEDGGAPVLSKSSSNDSKLTTVEPANAVEAKTEPVGQYSVTEALQQSRRRSKNRPSGMMQALRDLSSKDSKPTMAHLKESIGIAEELLSGATAEAAKNSEVVKMNFDPIPDSECEPSSSYLEGLTDLNAVDFSRYKRSQLAPRDYDEEVSIPEGELEHQQMSAAVEESLKNSESTNQIDFLTVDLTAISESMKSWDDFSGGKVDEEDELRDKRLAEVREVFARAKAAENAGSTDSPTADLTTGAIAGSIDSSTVGLTTGDLSDSIEVSVSAGDAEQDATSDGIKDATQDAKINSDLSVDRFETQTNKSNAVPEVNSKYTISQAMQCTPTSGSKDTSPTVIDLGGKSDMNLTDDEQALLQNLSRDLYEEMRNKPMEVIVVDRGVEESAPSGFGVGRQLSDNQPKDDFTYSEILATHQPQNMADGLLDLASELGDGLDDSNESSKSDFIKDDSDELLSALGDSEDIKVSGESRDLEESDEDAEDDVNVTQLLSDISDQPHVPEVESSAKVLKSEGEVEVTQKDLEVTPSVPKAKSNDKPELDAPADLEIAPISEYMDTKSHNVMDEVVDFISYGDLENKFEDKSVESKDDLQNLELEPLDIESDVMPEDLLNLSMSPQESGSNKCLHINVNIDSFDISGKNFEYDDVEFEDADGFVESKSEVKFESSTEGTSIKVESLVDPQDVSPVEPKVRLEVEPSAKPEVKLEVEPSAKPEDKPSVEPEVKLEVEPSAKPEDKPPVEPEDNLEDEPLSEIENKPSVEPADKPAVKPEVVTDKLEPVEVDGSKLVKNGHKSKPVVKEPKGVRPNVSRPPRASARQTARAFENRVMQPRPNSAQNSQYTRGPQKSQYAPQSNNQQYYQRQAAPQGYIVPPVKPTYRQAPLIPNPRGFAAESAQYFRQQQGMRTFETFQGYTPQIKQVSQQRPVSRTQGNRVMHGNRVKTFRRVVVVGSVSHQSGCSSLAYNIACGYGAEPGNKVLLMDLDILNPGLSLKVYQTFRLNYHDTCGIDSILQTNADAYISNIDLFTKHVMNNRGEGFSLIRGNSVYNADIKRALTSANFTGLIDRLSEIFNVVIIDLGDCSRWLPYQQYLVSKYYTVMLYNCFNKKSIMESHQGLLDLATPFDFVLTRYNISVNPVELELNLHRRFIGKISESRTLLNVMGVCSYSDVMEDSVASDWQAIRNNLIHS